MKWVIVQINHPNIPDISGERDPCSIGGISWDILTLLGRNTQTLLKRVTHTVLEGYPDTIREEYPDISGERDPYSIGGIS